MQRTLFNPIVVFILLIGGGITAVQYQATHNPWWFVLGGASLLLALSSKIVDQWDRMIILRLGKFHRIIGPGAYFIIPFVDHVAGTIDMRIRVTTFNAEKTLTKDTVPVDVDAVLFWEVVDAQKAALEVERYDIAVAWAAQTALRDTIGRTMLAVMLSERETLDKDLKNTIDHKSEAWGIKVMAVEIRDIRIPGNLEDAMSRQAQADREGYARTILATSEIRVAEEIAKAADIYDKTPHAMTLRAMNMTYEAVKERGALMLIPTSMVSSLSAGDFAGLGALGAVARESAKEQSSEERADEHPAE